MPRRRRESPRSPAMARSDDDDEDDDSSAGEGRAVPQAKRRARPRGRGARPRSPPAQWRSSTVASPPGSPVVQAPPLPPPPPPPRARRAAAAMIDSHAKRGLYWRLENNFFSIVYLVQKDVFYSKVFYVAAVVQGLNLLAAAFSSQFAWSDRVVGGSGLRGLMRAVSLDTLQLDEPVFLALYGLALLLVLSTAGLVGFMGHAIGTGNVPPLRVSRLLQRLVSLEVAFQGPLTGVLVSMCQCGAGSSDPEVSDWRRECVSSPGAAALFSVSVLGLVTFVVFVLLFSRMHSYGPTSYDSSSRPVTWIDTLYSAVQISVIISFRLEQNSTVALAVFYTLANAAMLGLVAGLVPFYREQMNSLRVAIHAVCTWTGACLVAVSLVDNAADDVASTVFVSGVVPVAVYAWHASRERADRLEANGAVRAALLVAREAAEDGALEAGGAAVADACPAGAGADVPADGPLAQCLAIEDVPDHVDRLSEESILQTWGDACGAYLAEVSTRFMVTGCGARPTAENVAAADLLFREALVRYPRSEYLLMRYVEFLLTFKDDDLTLVNLLVARSSSVEWESSETRFDVLRFAKELNRTRQEAAGAGPGSRRGRSIDVITHEEVLKTLSRTRRDHVQSKRVIDQTFALIRSGSANAGRLTRLVERQYELQERALTRFEFLLSHVPNNRQVALGFASFLEDVMLDPEAAQQLREDTDAPGADGRSASRAGGSSRAGRSSNAGSRASAARAQESRIAAIKKIRDMRARQLRKHALKMRLVSFLLLAAVVAVVVVYVLLFDSYEADLLNLNDSGVRRAMVTQAGYHSRTMHLAAVAGDADAFEAASAALLGVSASLLAKHTDLVHRYALVLDEQRSFYHDATVPYRVAAETGGDPDAPQWQDLLVSGADSVLRVVQDAQAVARAGPAAFVAYDASVPSSFPELFQMLHNPSRVFRELDTSTYLYQAAAEHHGDVLVLGILVSGCVAAVMELVIVIVVFRPAVVEEFNRVREAVAPVLRIPSRAATRVEQLRSRTGLMLGKGDADDDARASARRDPTRFMSVSSRRGSAAPSPRSPSRFSGVVAAVEPMAPVQTRRRGAGGRLSVVTVDEPCSPVSPRWRTGAAGSPPGSPPGSGRVRLVDPLGGGGGGTSSAPSSPRAAPHARNRSLTFAAPHAAPASRRASFTRGGKAGADGAVAKDSGEKADPGAAGVPPATAAPATAAATAAATAGEADGDASDAAGDATDKRQKRVTAVYVASLLCIVGALVAMTTYAAVSVGYTASAGAELNNAGRMRGLLERSSVYARELLLGASHPATLRGGLVEAFATTDSVRCHCRDTTNALATAHLGLLGGRHAIEHEVPALTGWDAVRYDDECSAFTPVERYFDSSLELPGLRDRAQRTNDLLYRGSCLSALPGVWYSGGVAVASKPRVAAFVAAMSPDKCPLHDEGDLIVSQGLHPAVGDVSMHYRRLARAPDSLLDTAHPSYAFVGRYHTGESQELRLGVLRLLLEIQAETQETLDNNSTIVIFLVSAAALVVVVQHLALSTQLGAIISHNIGMRMTVERLVKYSRWADRRVALLTGGRVPSGSSYGDDSDAAGDSDQGASDDESTFGGRRLSAASHSDFGGSWRDDMSAAPRCSLAPSVAGSEAPILEEPFLEGQDGAPASSPPVSPAGGDGDGDVPVEPLSL